MHRPVATLCLVVSATACRIGYEPLAPAEDAAVPAADAPTLADAAVPADAACDPSASLTADFAALPPGFTLFESGGATAALLGGRLRATPASAAAGTVYAGVSSNGAYDLTGHLLSVEVPTMVSTATHAQALFQCYDRADNLRRVGFEQQHGALHMFVDGVGGTSEKSIPYDAVAQRFWRLGEDAGMVRFSTSPDGSAWTEELAAPADFALDQLRIELSAGSFQPETAPGFSEFDQLAGTVPGCAVAP